MPDTKLFKHSVSFRDEFFKEGNAYTITYLSPVGDDIDSDPLNIPNGITTVLLMSYSSYKLEFSYISHSTCCIVSITVDEWLKYKDRIIIRQMRVV
jgi:hypothetical protein